VEELLAELEPMLYGLNYQVHFSLYRVPFDPAAPAEWYITQALGPDVVIGGVKADSKAEAIVEVEQSLCYSGDESSGPKQSVLQSKRFNELVTSVLAELDHAIGESTLFAQFWLRQGHPHYPVFWDFAFVIAGPSGGLVFIGSSSD
jgi:hypothetical protein